MKKILVACDDGSLAMLYSLELTEEGYDIVVVGNSSELRENLDSDRPDLIIVALPMDRYGNSDFSRTIQDAESQLPVIHCLDFPPTEHDPMPLSIHNFVLKSSNLKELKTKIKKTWGSRPDFAKPAGIVRSQCIPARQIAL